MNTQTTGNQIIENERLVYYAANYFNGYHNKEDLVQAGFLGMNKALKNYNPESENKFTTYAHFYVMGEMKKQIREDKGIKISRNTTKLYLTIERERMNLCQKLYRMPTNHELAEYLNIPYSVVSDALNSVQPIYSLDEPVNDEGKELNLYDTVADKEPVDIHLLMMLKEEFKYLSQEEQIILSKRYMEDLTQQEVAEILGISQVQVYRKERKVLDKLKERMTN